MEVAVFDFPVLAAEYFGPVVTIRDTVIIRVPMHEVLTVEALDVRGAVADIVDQHFFHGAARSMPDHEEA